MEGVIDPRLDDAKKPEDQDQDQNAAKSYIHAFLLYFVLLV